MNRREKRAAASIPDEDLRRVFELSPFTRLARVHVLSTAGDALFTLGLAGTVFFAVGDLDQARWRVALTLLFTIAPFAAAVWALLFWRVGSVREGRAKPLAWMALSGVVLIGPWLVRSVVLSGYPLYPIAVAGAPVELATAGPQ